MGIIDFDIKRFFLDGYIQTLLFDNSETCFWPGVLRLVLTQSTLFSALNLHYRYREYAPIRSYKYYQNPVGRVLYIINVFLIIFVQFLIFGVPFLYDNFYVWVMVMVYFWQITVIYFRIFTLEWIEHPLIEIQWGRRFNETSYQLKQQGGNFEMLTKHQQQVLKDRCELMDQTFEYYPFSAEQFIEYQGAQFFTHLILYLLGIYAVQHNLSDDPVNFEYMPSLCITLNIFVFNGIYEQAGYQDTVQQ